MVIVFTINLNPEQSKFFVETLLSYKKEILSDGELGSLDDISIWMNDNPIDFFSSLELWQDGEPLKCRIRDIFGLKLRDWAEKKSIEILQKVNPRRLKNLSVESQLESILFEELPNPLTERIAKMRQLSGKAPQVTRFAKMSQRDQTAIRGLLLILNNMHLFSGWGKGKTLV